MPFTSTANDLTTLTALKAWLRITDANADAALGRLITAASNMILLLIGRAAIVSQAYAETRDGHGGRRLMLRNFPITAVASLYIDNVLIPSAANSTQDGYLFSSDSIDLVGGTFSSGFSNTGIYVFTRGLSNVVVNYTAGYVVNASFELLTLEQACLELCAQKWARLGHIDLSSKSTGHETIVFSQKDIPAEVRTLIQPYRALGIL